MTLRSEISAVAPRVAEQSRGSSLAPCPLFIFRFARRKLLGLAREPSAPRRPPPTRESSHAFLFQQIPRLDRVPLHAALRSSLLLALLGGSAGCESGSTNRAGGTGGTSPPRAHRAAAPQEAQRWRLPPRRAAWAAWARRAAAASSNGVGGAGGAGGMGASSSSASSVGVGGMGGMSASSSSSASSVGVGGMGGMNAASSTSASSVGVGGMGGMGASSSSASSGGAGGMGASSSSASSGGAGGMGSATSSGSSSSSSSGGGVSCPSPPSSGAGSTWSDCNVGFDPTKSGVICSGSRQ